MTPKLALVRAVGSKAWLASAVVHGAVVIAVVGRPTPPVRAPDRILELDPAFEVAWIPPPPLSPLSPPPPPVPATLAPLPLLVPPPPATTARPAGAPRGVEVARADEAEAAKPSLAATDPTKVEVPAAMAASSGMPTFVMALPFSSGSSGATVGSALGAAVAKAGPASLEVVDESGVSTRAQVAYGPLPVYPRAARAAQIETDIPVDIVVNPSGSVIDARVKSRFGYGLEEATLDAIRQYRFTPALRDGHAVAVRMVWTMQYRLQ